MINYICRDLFTIVKKSELHQEKTSPTISIDIESLGEHITKCEVCKNQIESITKKFLTNPLQFLSLLKKG